MKKSEQWNENWIQKEQVMPKVWWWQKQHY